MFRPKQRVYSSRKIATRIAEGREAGWKELDLKNCGVRDDDLRALLREPGVEIIESLKLQRNQLTALPHEIGQLTGLTELWLNGNQLTALPPEIGQLTELADLRLDSNQLTALPAEIGQLTELTDLRLEVNQLTTLPPEIGKLTALTALNLHGNRLTALPPEISQLTALTTLWLQRNQLTELPPEIGQLTALTALNLKSNKLTALPPEILQLTALTELWLNGNQLRALPPEIGQLTALTYLSLDSNQFTALPPEMGQLTALTHLWIDGNPLTELPPEIGQLTALTGLYLEGNQLTALPPEIGQLTALTVLVLNGNQLTALPPEIGQLTALTALRLDENPLPDALLEAAEQGAEAVLAYVRGLAQAAAEAVYEGKLLLVGEGKVGKSCLLAALRGEEFQQDRPTTHGIDIKVVEVSHPRDDAEIRLNAWDFGGQEVYRIAHQFFFSRHALYLVLWNTRLGARQCDLEPWLKRIKLRVGDEAKIIVVATYYDTDQRLLRIDEEELRRKFTPCIAGFCEVDNATGYGIDTLKEMIGRAAAELPQMGDPYPATWKSAQDELLDLAVGGEDRSALTHMSYPDFHAICRKHEVEDDAMPVLARLLDQRGRIVYYGDEDRLANTIILRPDWLTRAISYVLEDKDTNHARGVLRHDRLHKIWHDHGDPQKDQYQPHLYSLFIRLMERFDICYRMEDLEADLVGQLVGVQRPTGVPWSSTDAVAPGATALKLTCRMDEDPPGLVPWMIVRTHRYNRQHLHWQNGIFLNNGHHGTALIDFRDRELRLEVRAQYPSHFMSILSGALESLIEDRWPGLKGKYKMTVPCPGTTDIGTPCPGRFPISTLRKRRAEGESSKVNCNECGADYEIDMLLTGFGRTVEEMALQHIQESVDKLLENRPVTVADLQDLRGFILSGKRRCPALFSLLPETLSRWNPANWMKEGYRLTLWCEHLDGAHPCCEIGSGGIGEYVIARADDHLRALAPYATVVARLLSVALNVTAPGAGLFIDPAVAAAIRPHLDTMKAVTSTLLTGEFDAPLRPSRPLLTGGLREMEGADLRALEALLVELDPERRWGGLRPTTPEIGGILWLCPEHYRQYVPDSPKIPATGTTARPQEGAPA